MCLLVTFSTRAAPPVLLRTLSQSHSWCCSQHFGPTWKSSALQCNLWLICNTTVHMKPLIGVTRWPSRPNIKSGCYFWNRLREINILITSLLPARGRKDEGFSRSKIWELGKALTMGLQASFGLVVDINHNCCFNSEWDGIITDSSP